MQSYGIHFFITTDDTIKCALAERFNHTLRERIYRYLYHHNTNRYIDVFPRIVEAYNNSYHRTLKMSPVSAKPEHLPQILKNLKVEKPIFNPGSEFNFGDFVRVSRKKGTFEKGAHQDGLKKSSKLLKRRKLQENLSVVWLIWKKNR